MYNLKIQMILQYLVKNPLTPCSLIIDSHSLKKLFSTIVAASSSICFHISKKHAFTSIS